MNDKTLREKLLELLGLAMLLMVVLVVLASGANGCGHSPPAWTGGAISCTSQAVQRNWTRAYPEVQTCLSVASVDPIKCLDAVPSLVQVGIDVVACIVRGSGKEASAQFNTNPSDELSGRKAARAELWIREKGFQFQ
jgi:hypothetical protein